MKESIRYLARVFIGSGFLRTPVDETKRKTPKTTKGNDFLPKELQELMDNKTTTNRTERRTFFKFLTEVDGYRICRSVYCKGNNPTYILSTS